MIRVGNKSACSVAKLNSSIGNPWVQELIPVKMKRIPFHWSLRFLLSAQARVQAPKCDHGEDDPKLQPMPSPAACIHLELMKTYWNYWNKREGTWDKATQQETNEYKWDKTWQDNSTKKSERIVKKQFFQKFWMSITCSKDAITLSMQWTNRARCFAPVQIMQPVSRPPPIWSATLTTT